MPVEAPELHEKRDGQREIVKRINWLLRHQGGTGTSLVFVDGISIGTIQLSTLNSANLSAGSIVYVDSVGDYFGLKLPTATIAADGITRVDASNKTGYQWERLGIQNLDWAARLTWYIDPNGSDEASGASSTTPLATLAEMRRRWNDVDISANATINILGNCASTDINTWNVRPAPGVIITLQGALDSSNAIYSGTVTGFVAAANIPTADDIELTDAAIPTSYTASGLLAPGVIFKRTSSTALYWYALKDLGAKTIRITAPMNNIGVQLNASLAVASTYTAYQMYTIYSQNWGDAVSRIRCDSLYDVGATNENVAGYGIQRRRIWMGGARLVVAVDAHSSAPINCMFASTSLNMDIAAPAESFIQIQGGGALGNGAGTLFGAFGATTLFVGAFVSQGRQIASDVGLVQIEVSSAVHDCSIPMIHAHESSTFSLMMFTSAGGGLSGKGNTDKIAATQDGGRMYYGESAALPPFTAASTTDPHPFSVAGTDYDIGDLPIQDFTRGQGIYRS